MRTRLSHRCCVLLLCAAVLWLLCGAPLTAEEWRGLPDYWRLQLWQAPDRIRRLLQQWPLASAAAQTRDCGLTLALYRTQSKGVQTILLEDYVRGCVAAEMPASYAHDALCSQAVAARTYAVSRCIALGGSGCASHPGADVCDSSACCQGYLDKGILLDTWGENHAILDARVSAAAQSTAGLILTSDGLPIEALYHASSGGVTEDAASVFASGRSYLVSVESPGEEGFSQYLSEMVLSREEACALLLEAFPQCGVTAEGLPGQLRLQSSTPSGRIDTVLVGKQTVSGAALRQALGLRSTLCTWEYIERDIRFIVRGYGHGVGMSQTGAQAMAAAGTSYHEILSHYYTGAHITLLPSLHDVRPLRVQ